MSDGLPLWIEITVALLLALSGVFALAAAIGLLRFKTFFMRLHPPALAFSLAAWCVTLASILFFTALGQKLSLQNWLIIIFLAMTVPVTTTLLARTELFRQRTRQPVAGDVPAPLSEPVAGAPEPSRGPGDGG
jgi:multicomponent K+:H+ antiporter subunit G